MWRQNKGGVDMDTHMLRNALNITNQYAVAMDRLTCPTPVCMRMHTGMYVCVYAWMIGWVDEEIYVHTAAPDVLEPDTCAWSWVCTTSPPYIRCGIGVTVRLKGLKG